MQSQISNIMNDLVQNPSEAMPYQVQATVSYTHLTLPTKWTV